MTDLKTCFEKHGFSNVTTYIQSGNVIFEAPKQNISTLTSTVEAMLVKTFGYKAKAIVYTPEHLEQIVHGAPKGFGTKPTDYRYYVLFLKTPLTAAEALAVIPLKEGVDEAWAGPGAIFHQRLETKATQSYLNKLVAMPIYQDMTIRNWNTTQKLLKLMNPSH